MSDFITLAHSNSIWEGFAGAMRFRDGTAPLFCEMHIANCPLENAEGDATGAWGMLILDEQESEVGAYQTVLTVNLMDDDGCPATYTKALPASVWARAEAQRWAEETLKPITSHKDLLVAGFEYDEN